MKLKPVEQHPSPGYPRRDEATVKAEVLIERIPAAWRRFGGAASLLVAAGLSGCGQYGTQISTASPTTRPDPVVWEAANWVFSLQEDIGQQQFMLGCVAIMPPAVHPEDSSGASSDRAKILLDGIKKLNSQVLGDDAV